MNVYHNNIMDKKQITLMMQEQLDSEIKNIVRTFKLLDKRIDDLKFSISGDFHANVMNYGNYNKHIKMMAKLNKCKMHYENI